MSSITHKNGEWFISKHHLKAKNIQTIFMDCVAQRRKYHCGKYVSEQKITAPNRFINDTPPAAQHQKLWLANFNFGAIHGTKNNLVLKIHQTQDSDTSKTV